MTQSAEKLPVAQNRDAWNLFVFRKSRESLPLSHLAAGLEAEIRKLSSDGSAALDALVRAGEIETGLADAGAADADLSARITDKLATCALGLPIADKQQALDLLARIATSGAILCSHPEGFSYYGLNPLDFADLIESIKAELAPRVAIIGIRSVGSTLGAIVAAALGRAGKVASRITVRPAGEPYQRKASFNARQLAWIKSELEGYAEFLVVDEGPGFSGSTFLSVAGALEKAGVPSSRIILLCSRPFALRANSPGLAKEWQRYRSRVVQYGRNVPAEAGPGMGGGVWRDLLYEDPARWPACWSELERIKHLSLDGRSLFKFEGFGRFGQLARDQAWQLGEAHLSPCLLAFENGYGRYDFVLGRPLSRDDLCRELLDRMAQYCAFRAAHFPVPTCDPDLIRTMVRANLKLELGIDHPFSDFAVERPVYADCRMLPHEWILATSGKVFKTDATGHGDGHLLPGPVDVAWDLAGLIVEWGLGPAESSYLLREYLRHSGDHAELRISHYLLFYAVFRMAFCRMAAAALAGSEEAKRLLSAYKTYEEKVYSLLYSRP